MNNVSINLPLTRHIIRDKFRTMMILMLVVSSIFIAYSFYQNQKDFRVFANDHSDTLAANLSDILATQGPDQKRQLQNMLMVSSQHNRAIASFIYLPSGEALLAWSEKNQLIPTAGLDKVTQPDHPTSFNKFKVLDSYSPIVVNNEYRALVRLQFSTEQLIRKTLQQVIVALVGSLIVAGIGAYLLTVQVLKTIEPTIELTQLAEKVAVLGDYSVRAQVYKEHPMNSLIVSFNQMLTRMQNWEADTQSEARERREAESRLAILNNHDSLTKLPNRHYFHRLLTNAIEDTRGQKDLMALMFIDIDQFKAINDDFGYDAGDLVLATIANRLCNALRNTDTLCRVDGDEFSIILPQVHSIEVVRQLAQRFLNILQQPLVVRGKQIIVSACIGVACFPIHAKEQRQLLHNTDLALQQAKLNGRLQYFIYEDNMKSSEQEQQFFA